MTKHRVIWSCCGWKLAVQIPYLVFVCCAVLLCFSLAYWQWHRAQAAALRYHTFQQQQAQPISLLSASAQPYQKVTVAGEIQQHFLLDNQIYQSVPGRHVLAVVQTDNITLLVDLGWQPKQFGLTLQQPLPQHVEIQGRLKQPQTGVMLQNAEDDPNWPQLMQQIQIPLLNQHLGFQLFPFVLYAETPVAGLIPTPVTVPNKYYIHIGYVIQWLLIAAAFVIGFILFCKREHQQYETQ